MRHIIIPICVLLTAVIADLKPFLEPSTCIATCLSPLHDVRNSTSTCESTDSSPCCYCRIYLNVLYNPYTNEKWPYHDCIDLCNRTEAADWDLHMDLSCGWFLGERPESRAQSYCEAYREAFEDGGKDGEPSEEEEGEADGAQDRPENEDLKDGAASYGPVPMIAVVLGVGLSVFLVMV